MSPMDPEERALAVVKQYLREQGWTQTLRSLEVESAGQAGDPGSLHHASMLLDMVCRRVLEECGEEEAAADSAAGMRRAVERALATLPDAEPLPEQLRFGIRGTHSGAVTCVDCINVGDGPAALHGISSGADGVLALFSLSNGTVLSSARVAPCGILSLAPGPTTSGSALVALGCMDGSVHVCRVQGNDQAPEVVASSSSGHRKYVVALCWAQGGARLVSGGWDDTLALHAWDAALGQLRLEHRVDCGGQVESVVRWGLKDGSRRARDGTSSSAQEEGEVLVAVRGSTFLEHYAITPAHSSGGGEVETAARTSSENPAIDADLDKTYGNDAPPAHQCRLQRVASHGLNDDEADPHLSFSAVWLSPSPDGRFLAVATDGGRVLVMGRAGIGGTLRPLRRCFGLAQDKFQTWRVCWAAAGLLAASAPGGLVYLFRAATGQCVAQIRAHSPAAVRGLCCVLGARAAVLDRPHGHCEEGGQTAQAAGEGNGDSNNENDAAAVVHHGTSLLLTCSFDGSVRVFGVPGANES